jgi:hypothetical protein
LTVLPSSASERDDDAVAGRAVRRPGVEDDAAGQRDQLIDAHVSRPSPPLIV